MAELWKKPNQTATLASIAAFCIGDDPVLDQNLAVWDIIGSVAHAKMLSQVGLISEVDYEAIVLVLSDIYTQAKQGPLPFEPADEDIHTYLERVLTERIGKAGKRIHTGRSRNDQVLTAIKLYSRHELQTIVSQVAQLSRTLLEAAECQKDVILPGFTHTQVAMPSSAGLWLSAYAEALAEDLDIVLAAYRHTNRNPLGSGAGYGGSLPLDRDLTTKLLGFESPHINVVNAQMSRGKLEWLVLTAVAGIANTIGKLADDVCLYNAQFLGLITLPESFTTGSSIMPHKRNPDVFELIRGHCNLVKGYPAQIMALTTNQTSGYHRDYQLSKGIMIKAIVDLQTVLTITQEAIGGIKFDQTVANNPRYRDMYSVEGVNALVKSGIPFREAYQTVGTLADADKPTGFEGQHTLLGSIHNLGLDRIETYLGQQMAQFGLTEYTHWLNGFEEKYLTPKEPN
jgi:argininosuccinate lyase